MIEFHNMMDFIQLNNTNNSMKTNKHQKHSMKVYKYHACCRLLESNNFSRDLNHIVLYFPIHLEQLDPKKGSAITMSVNNTKKDPIMKKTERF